MAKEQSRYKRENPYKQNQQQKQISRSIISSLFFSSVSTTTKKDSSASDKKKNKFLPSMKFIGLGCKSSSKVFVPSSVIKPSGNWEAKKFKKKNKGSNTGEELDNGNWVGNNNNTQSLSSSGVHDVFCNDKEGNDDDEAADAVDWVFPRRHYFGPHTEIEIMPSTVEMDIYRDNWRLDIDHMSYEELLALSDSIGYESTGLKEDEIQSCVTKLDNSFQKEREKKCSICQEEYEANNERGKLKCGHFFHMQCIKQWLQHKNSCPMCKTEVLLKR